jgi:hypothetical protein
MSKDLVTCVDEEWKLGNLLSVEASEVERKVRDKMRRLRRETGSLCAQMLSSLSEQESKQQRLWGTPAA